MKKKLLCLLLGICICLAALPCPEVARAAATTVYIITNTLPAYSYPSTASGVMGVMSYGEAYTCVAVQGDWARIVNSAGDVGYCAKEGLSQTNPNDRSVPMYAKSNGVNVYRKPLNSSGVMMTLPQNACYTCIAVTSDGQWARLVNGSYYGYVPMSDLSETPVQGSTYTVYISANTLQAYASPSESSAGMGVMSYGESYLCLATSGDWARIQNGSGAIAYCLLSGLTTTDPNTLSRAIYINTANVPVYRKPTTSSGIMMYLSKNASYTARALTADGGWYRLQNGSYYGYVQAEYISFQQMSGEDTYLVYVSDNTLLAYASPSTSSSSLGRMSYGESMTCLAVSGDWARIQNAYGAIGYCLLSGLTRVDPNIYSQTIYIKQSGAMLYSKPDTGYATSVSLKVNDSYTAVALTKDNVWIRVKFGSGYAYVPAQVAANAPVDSTYPATVYVTGNTLSVYAYPTESASCLGVMSYGESMILYATEDGWSKVANAAGTIGYCRYNGISRSDPNGTAETVYAQSDGVYVYKKPLTDAAVYGTLSRGDAVSRVAVTQDGVWARVMSSTGSYGYVRTEDIGTDRPSSSTDGVVSISPITVYISANTLNCYATSDEASSVLGVMSYGENYTCIAYGNGWAKIRNSAGMEGYCQTSGLTTTNPNISTAKTMYAQSAGVKVYSKPLTSATVYGTLSLNESVSAIALTGDSAWLRLQRGSVIGYAEAKYFATTMTDGGTSAKAAAIIALAQQQLGKSYQYAAKGPDTFDCSGLIYYVFGSVLGIKLQRTAYLQGYDESYTLITSLSDLQPGDVVFFNTVDDSDLCDHAGIYIGGGKMIHASSVGGKVITSSLTSGYYNRTFSWARRIL